jgi:predicted DCC family thiol-disulfide oxidoreductase YuxK
LSKSIVLFDGVCNLCSSSVQWIIKHDKKEKFQFASLQGPTGQAYKARFNIPDSVDSVLLIENDTLYVKSTAALRIARGCNSPWPALYVFIVVPKFIRNGIYDFIAKNRYKWFGKQESCWLPSPSLKARFID